LVRKKLCKKFGWHRSIVEPRKGLLEPAKNLGGVSMNLLNSRAAVRFAFTRPALCTLALFVISAASTNGQVPNNVLTRVLLIQVGADAGSGFTVDVDGRQYIITAKHVVSTVKDNDSIRVHRLDGWKAVHVKVLRCDDPVDIAVLIPDKQVTLNYPLEPSAAGMQLGQDTYFLGYPFGELFSDVNYEKVGNHISIPFIKKAIWSASLQTSNGSIIFLDGHNNPGFSGGPIVFRDFGQSGYVMKVAGVISGYRPDFESVLEPIKVKPGEDLHDVEPWRIVTIKGEKFRLADTEQLVDTNSGIVKGFAIDSAVELIKKHPDGPQVTEGLPPL
jgi:hypothetical protein